jgi:hypothetical protein
VDYDRVIADPAREAERFAGFLGLPYGGVDLAAAAHAVRPELRRHHAERDSPGAAVPPAVAELRAALLAAAAAAGADAGDALDAIRPART